MKRLLLKIILFSSFFGLNSYAGVIPIDEVFEPQGRYPTESFVKVGVVAWVGGVAPLPAPNEAPQSYDQRVEAFKQSNRESLAHYIKEAATNGAEIVITPEFGTVGYPDHPEIPDAEDNFISEEEIAPFSETTEGPSYLFFSKLADELDIYIHFGLVENIDNKYYNTVFVVGPEGELVLNYHKIHLFQVENDFLTAGSEIKTYDSPAGKIGIIICSDVYGSFAMNSYATEEVDVLALSTSWAQYNTGWDYFTRGAMRVGSYLLAANQTYYPDSGVINPDGTSQSHIRQSEGVAYGYLPRK